MTRSTVSPAQRTTYSHQSFCHSIEPQTPFQYLWFLDLPELLSPPGGSSPWLWHSLSYPYACTLPSNAKCNQQLGLWEWIKSLWTAPRIVIYPSDHQDGFTITSRARIKALNSTDTTSALSVLPPLLLFCLILDSLASTFPAHPISFQNICITSGTWSRHNWKSAGVPTRL